MVMIIEAAIISPHLISNSPTKDIMIPGGSVLMLSLTSKVKAIMNSSQAMIKATILVAMSPGVILGSNTLLIASTLPHPSIMAASSKALGIVSK
ncbi:hypothetical protein ES703_54528 [subsurface metagenome]